MGLVDAMLVWSMLWLLNFVQLEYFCHGRACVVQEVLIVWGDHDQLFPMEKAFAVQRWGVSSHTHFGSL